MKMDFYLCEGQQPVFVSCKLLEKVYQQGLTAHAHCDTPEMAKQIDDTLWTFKDTSFVPHGMVGEDDGKTPPISIGQGEQMPPAIYDVLLVYAADLPEYATQFNRVLYVFPGDHEAWKTHARALYKALKDEGVEIEFHKV